MSREEKRKKRSRKSVNCIIDRPISGGFFEDLDVFVQQDRHGYERNGDATCHGEQRRVVAQPASSAAPRKKPTPRAFWIRRARRRVEKGVVAVTGDASRCSNSFRRSCQFDSAWAPMTYATDTHSTQAGECRARITSVTIQRESGEQGLVESSPAPTHPPSRLVTIPMNS